MKPSIVNKQAFTITGLKYEGSNSNDEIKQLWEEFVGATHKIENRVNHSEFFGYDTWTDKIQETGEFTYVAAVEVKDANNTPDGMVCIEIPSNKYAVFAIANADVDTSVKQIYSKWLPESGLKINGNYDFEYYDENYSPNDPDSKIHFHVPIK